MRLLRVGYRRRGWSVYKQKMPSETVLSASSLAMNSQVFLKPNEKHLIQVIGPILLDAGFDTR